MRTILTLQNIRFRYKSSDKPALEKVSLELKEGEFFALVGPNGAGKSTLCCCMNGLIPKIMRGELTGQTRLYDNDISHMKVQNIAPLVSMVFQDFESQLFSTNVRLELAFGPENLGIAPEIIDRLVRENMAKVGLNGMGERQPAYLSGGQKQRLAIGSVLTIEPDLLILDEPTTDLDPRGRTDIFHILEKLRNENLRTIFVVEHEMEELLGADRIGVLIDGRLVRIGRSSEIFEDCSFMRENGIRPPQMYEISNSLKLDLNQPDVDKVLTSLKHRGAGFRTDKCDALTRRSEMRAESYGGCIIQVSDVGFSYSENSRILKDIHLDIKAGELVAIVGQNGSGKTTLAKQMNGLLKPDSGTILMHGSPVHTYSNLERAQLIGYVFQNPDHQIFSKTVREEVSFNPKLAGIKGSELETRVMESLRSVGLLEESESDPFLLTKGGRQRVAVASLLAANCDILMFDEPTTGLDFSEIKTMMDLVVQLNAGGKTIIMITHNMYIVAEYAHRVVVMNQGKITLDLPTRCAFSKERELEELSLKPPPVTALGNRLGFTTLSISEFLDLVHIQKERQ